MPCSSIETVSLATLLLLLKVTPVLSAGCGEQPLIGSATQGILDASLTASSSWPSGFIWDHGPWRSRLNARRDQSGRKIGAWCAARNVQGQWIQVDFQKVMYITAIATKGRSDLYRQFVKSYEIRYSDDRKTWTNYTEGGRAKVFDGNRDQETLVRHKLGPLSARYVRLYPRTWYSHMSLRWELYGCVTPGKACKPTALISGSEQRVRDDQLTSSSFHDSPYDHRPSRSRLNATSSWSPRRAGAWCARYNFRGQWIQADIGTQMLISSIATRGRQDHFQWVTSYQIKYSNDSTTWVPYTEDGGITKIFQGNADRNTVVQHPLQPAFRARYVRLYPTAWHRHISLRWELYACSSPGTVVAVSTRVPEAPTTGMRTDVPAAQPVATSRISQQHTATVASKSTRGVKEKSKTPTASVTAKTPATAQPLKASSGGPDGSTRTGIVVGSLLAVVVAVAAVIILFLWRRKLMKQQSTSLRFSTLQN